MHRPRHMRNWSVGQIDTLDEIKMARPRSNSEQLKEGINKFEYLQYKYPSASMIRATPNSVRWDEINRVKYRFQALHFTSDVLNGLLEYSPPLTRREKAITNSEPQKEPKHCHSTSDDTSGISYPHVKCISRNTSFDSCDDSPTARDYLHKRKASVVQVTKDDTSDYNSDEDVFSDGQPIYNTTLYHVENRQIKDCTEIQVTKRPFNRRNKIYMNKNNFNSDSDGTYTKENLEQKSKEELIEMIQHLQSLVVHTDSKNKLSKDTGDTSYERKTESEGSSNIPRRSNYENLEAVHEESNPEQSTKLR